MKIDLQVQEKANALSYEGISLGDYAEFNETISEEKMRDFARFSGDLNPLHTDEIFAAKTPFRKRVVYGMLVASFFSKLVGMYLPGRNCLYLSQSLQFLKPVNVEDSILVRGEVVSKKDNKLVLETKILKKEIIVVDGMAEVLVLPMNNG